MKDLEYNPNDFENILTKISAIIDWYRGLPTHIKANEKNINQLTRARRKLATYRVDLSAHVAEFMKFKEVAYFDRKKTNAEKYAEHRENYNQGDAKEKAFLETEKERAREIQYEAAYKKAALIHESTGDVLNAMAGDINHLSYEYKMAGVVAE